MIATLLASPHTLDCDLTILGPAMAFFIASSWSNDFRDFDISVLAVAWIAPLVGRAVQQVRPGSARPVAIVPLYALTLRHGMRAAIGVARIAQA
jgi:hypothetical protein